MLEEVSGIRRTQHFGNARVKTRRWSPICADEVAQSDWVMVAVVYGNFTCTFVELLEKGLSERGTRRQVTGRDRGRTECAHGMTRT